MFLSLRRPWDQENRRACIKDMQKLRQGDIVSAIWLNEWCVFAGLTAWFQRRVRLAVGDLETGAILESGWDSNLPIIRYNPDAEPELIDMKRVQTNGRDWLDLLPDLTPCFPKEAKSIQVIGIGKLSMRFFTVWSAALGGVPDISWITSNSMYRATAQELL